MKILLTISILMIIFSNIFAKDMKANGSGYGAGINYHKYILFGKNEKCDFSYTDYFELFETNCLTMTNSKGKKIFCTPKKTICKTKKELDDFSTFSIYGKSKKTKALIILNEWTEANNKKNIKKLESLYAQKLNYYGKDLAKTKCIKDKEKAFKKYPNFFQQISSIKYIKVLPNIYKVTFDKGVQYKLSKKFKNYPSYLLINIKTSKILAEGDEVTDAKKSITTYDAIYTDSNGVEYKTLFNSHGAIMTNNNDKIYIGKDCDVVSKKHGKGEWEWANTGFEIRFKNTTLIFRGELNIENDGKCGYDFYNKNDDEVKETLSPKQVCKKAENDFSTEYKKFTDAQLEPNETQISLLKKQAKARDFALKFIKACDGISRNTFLNGGYDLDEVKDFVRKTNAQIRLLNIFR